MKLTNEEIARVYRMYMPCEIADNGKRYELDGILKNENGLTFFTVDKNMGLVERREQYHDFKLLLTPLSKISDEDAIEVAKFHYGRDTTWRRETLIEDGKRFVKDISWLTASVAIEVFQYLISKGYAVPLFFGVGHWANGKTAIELGIAIEK